jgi:hypothetical protein
MWTFAVTAFGWLQLPRMQDMPHDPDFLSKLSREAVSILSARETKTEPVRGALVWLDGPRVVRMLNGALLTFPAITTDKQVALVENEYRQLLDVEAGNLPGPFVLEMLALWLAPLLVTGLLLHLFHCVQPRSMEKNTSLWHRHG